MAPTSPTCNGKVYDFFVVAQQLSHNVLGCRTICGAGLHPHSPAHIYLNDRVVTAWVRQPDPVEALPAILPHGPLEASYGDEFGALVMQAIETELYELLAHQRMDGEHSRADGPALVWRQLQHQPTLNHGRRNPLVHGESVVVCLLRTLLTSNRHPARQSAKWRLLYLDIDVEIKDPCEDLRQSVLVFKVWRGRLHVVPLNDSAVLKQPYAQALVPIRLAADQASRVVAKAFAKWLQEGLQLA